MAKRPDENDPNGEVDQKPKDADKGAPQAWLKPSVGRIVHYTPPDALSIGKVNRNEDGEEVLSPFPAIITHVHGVEDGAKDTGEVNLCVFPDSSFQSTNTMQPVRVRRGLPGDLGRWCWPTRG